MTERVAQRADTLLKQSYPGLTRRQIAEAFNLGLVRYQGRMVKKSASLEPGSPLECTGLDAHIELLVRGRDVPGVKPVELGRGFVVVAKPINVPSVPIGLEDTQTITAWTRFHYPEVNQNFASVQPELAVHRLDTDTAGLVIVALNPQAYGEWRKIFENHLVEKQYVAHIWGTPKKENFELLTPLVVKAGSPKVKLFDGSGNFQTAQSSIELLESDGETSKVRVTTTTGLRHQVRAQLAFAGYPLVGDSHYDPKFGQRSGPANNATYHKLWATKLTTPFGTYELPMFAASH